MWGKLIKGYFNNNGFSPIPAKIVYGLTLHLTLFLNKTYSFKNYEPFIGQCTFHVNLINSSDWEFAGLEYHCPMTNKYPSGYINFTLFREIIPTNYNATIFYPFQILFSAQSNSYFPINVISQPYTLQISV